MRQSFSR